MLIFWILFNRTVTGRRILATGVNAKTADYAGIDSGSTIRLAHGLSGLLAGLAAGVLTISKLGAAQTSIGSTWLLISFAAPILGGTLLSGGKVSIVGTFLSVGAIGGLEAVVCGALMQRAGIPWGFAIILAFVLVYFVERLTVLSLQDLVVLVKFLGLRPWQQCQSSQDLA